MLGRLHLYLLMIGLALTLCVGVPAHADTPAAIETEAAQTIVEIDSSVIVTLDGETLEDTRLHRGADGEIYVDALPIFTTLGNDVSFDGERKALIVRRSQDGVVMELHTETGVVRADGKALGALPVFGLVEPDNYRLTPNAIAVLSGASGTLDNENNRIDFELDARLRVATGFDIIVQGLPLEQNTPAPKTVGPILLLPLRPIAEALGHGVTVDGDTVRVERAQDSAVFTLDTATGVVSLFDQPIGLSEDASYIDPVELLLPVGVFESLTGTVVTPGEDGTIHVDLDRRLSDAVEPDGTVDAIAADTPLTVEFAQFEFGSQGINRVDVAGHARGFNGQLRAEIAQTPGTFTEAEPDWLSLDFQHISGISGSAGDLSVDRRELASVGVRRLRGLSLQKETDRGAWALAAGTPASGRRVITERQSRYSFDGLAAGVRYADKKGWEAGLAVRHDPLTDDQRAVLSAISGRLGQRRGGRTGWNASADLGVFDGPSRAGSTDFRLRAQLRHAPRKHVRLDTSLRYSGAEFTRSLLREEDLRRLEALQRAREAGLPEPEEDERVVPDVRQANLDALTVGASASALLGRQLGPLDGLSGSVSVSHNRSGVLHGMGEGQHVNAVTVSASTRVEPIDLSLTASLSQYAASASERTGDGVSGTNVKVAAYRDFEHVALRGQLDVTGTSETEARTVASLTATSRAIGRDLPRGARVSVRPSVTTRLFQNDWQMRGGVQATVNSGTWLGEKNRATASLGIIQSTSTRSGSRTSRYLSVDVARQVSLGDNMAMGVGYRADLRGRHDLRLILRGRYDFNRTRRLRRTDDLSGLLQGIAFIDENGDGIRQDDERGAGGVSVRLHGTPFALRTDVSGAYTLQNVKRGLYQVGIDNRSLPLGYGLHAEARTAVTIRPGHVTTLDLPVQKFGQIRGSVFEDADGNGQFDRGEARPESVTVELFDGNGERVAVTASTAFGQFAFDSLPLTDYTVRAVVDGAPGPQHDLDLRGVPGGMARTRLALPGAGGTRLVSAGAEPGANPPAQPSTGLPPP